MLFVIYTILKNIILSFLKILLYIEAFFRSLNFTNKVK